MYSIFRHWCERLLRIPHDPAPPPGDEATTRIFRAAPNYYRYLLCVWAIRSAAGILALVGAIVIPVSMSVYALVINGQNWGYLLALVPLAVLTLNLLLCLFTLAVVRLEYEKRWYLVTDRSLRIREGVVKVREMTVNFANIQNISITQGPIQRLLAIADLRVDTAGGGGSSAPGHQKAAENLHTAWFRGVNNANEIRELIQQRLQLLKDSGLGDREELISATMPAPISAAARHDGVKVSPALLGLLREIESEARGLRQALD